MKKLPKTLWSFYDVIVAYSGNVYNYSLLLTSVFLAHPGRSTVAVFFTVCATLLFAIRACDKGCYPLTVDATVESSHRISLKLKRHMAN